MSVLVSWSMLGESSAASKWVDICLLSRLNHLSSVQFKMASVGWGKPIYTQQSCRFFRGAFDTVFVWLGKIFECFLFLYISPPGDHWSNVFSILLAGSVSSVLNTSSISVNFLDVVQSDFFWFLNMFKICLRKTALEFPSFQVVGSIGRPSYQQKRVSKEHHHKARPQWGWFIDFVWSRNCFCFKRVLRGVQFHEDWWPAISVLSQLQF